MPWKVTPADKVRVFDVVVFEFDNNTYVVRQSVATPDNKWREFQVVNFDNGNLGKFTVHNNREMHVYHRRDS